MVLLRNRSRVVGFETTYKEELEMANGQPLCGWEWYQKHQFDYTQADIDAQTITVKVDNVQMPTVSNKNDKGKVSNLVKINRKS